MTAFNENDLNDPNESLRNSNQRDNAHSDQLGENTGSSAMETNPYGKAEDPSGVDGSGRQSENDMSRNEAFGENAGIRNSNSISNSSLQPGPDDDDDDLDDDDDDDLLDDDDTLIPIEGDEDDDTLLSDDDDDIIPGTDMDDGDDLLNDDDDLDNDNDSGVNRSTTGDLGANITRREDGRTTGRMIDHEPGTSGI